MQRSVAWKLAAQGQRQEGHKEGAGVWRAGRSVDGQSAPALAQSEGQRGQRLAWADACMMKP